MESWRLRSVEFEPGVWEEVLRFLEVYPQYEGMLRARIDDLIRFPELIWQEAHIVDGDTGYFITRNQRLELAGKVYRRKGLALITHFSYRS